MSNVAYITAIITVSTFMLATVLTVVGVLGGRIGDLRADVAELRRVTSGLVEDVVLLRGTQ